MTELIKKEFSRKSFVKGGGAMIIGFSALAGKAQAATGNTPFSQRGPQDFLPNLNTIDAWLAIRADNTVIVSHGEPEFAGTPTGILQLVAEELDVSMKQMEYAHPETWLNATGGGGGSGGIPTRSQQCRAAAAYARQELLKMASARLGVAVAALSVADGVVTFAAMSWLAIWYASEFSINRCMCFMLQLCSVNSTASQSSSSGWVGASPVLPKLLGVRTIPSPKWSCQSRFTITRAVSGLSREAIHSASPRLRHVDFASGGGAGKAQSDSTATLSTPGVTASAGDSSEPPGRIWTTGTAPSRLAGTS